jgi:RNA polymerase sigma-54 factor
LPNKKNNNLDAATLGKIVLARFLALPLSTYDRCVTRIESSQHFAALAPWVKPSILSHATACDGAAGTPVSSSIQTLGEIRLSRGRPCFVYHKPGFVREYRFDEAEIERIRHSQGFPGELTATLHRLRLINSRNRLTHALMEALIDIQTPYLVSSDPLQLAPLPQAHMSRLLLARGTLPLVPDPGRLSRLIRRLSFKMPDGKTQPLTALFPNARQLHCHRIDFLIKGEKTLLLDGHLARPLSDDAIAELMGNQYGVALSRRSIAAIRHQLAIPDWRRRGERKDYLAVTGGFSPLLPLTPQALSTLVPQHPGVYEIRSTASREDIGIVDYSSSPSLPRVVYIGSTRDLRKRLGDHLRGNSGNVHLSSYLAEGVARVRFRVVSEDWRSLERQLYHAFCETFGAPPPCNRMSP